MAKKKVKNEEAAPQRRAPVSFADIPGDESISDDEILSEELDQLLKEFGSEEIIVTIYRTDSKTGRKERIPLTPSVSEFNPDSVAAEWGGGKYQLIFKNEHGQIVKKKTITYAEKRAVAVAPQTGDKYLETISAMNKEMREIQSKNEDRIVTMFSKMIETQNARPVVDEFSRMRQYMDMFKMSSGKEDILDRLTQAIALGRELGSAESGGDSTIDQIVKAVKLLSPDVKDKLGNIIGALAGGGKPPDMPVIPAGYIPNPPAPVAGQVPPKPEIIEEEMEIGEYVLRMIRDNYKMFYGYAKAGTPVGLLAPFLLSNISDEDYPEFYEYLKEKGIADIVAKFPDLGACSEWLARLVVELMKKGDAAAVRAPVVTAPDGEGKPPIAP